MKKMLLPLLFLPMAMTAPVLASDSDDDDLVRIKHGNATADERDEYRGSAAGIVAALEADGYQVLALELEHGRFELKARRGGSLYEILAEAGSGEVLRIEADD